MNLYRISKRRLRASLQSKRDSYTEASRTSFRSDDTEAYLFYLGAVWAVDNIKRDIADD